ncbi:MAG: ADP-forming succinate--CoA ligase subunit beta [bacterium]|nr:ADP-forming succinate--CoA ligase subunit beta [bacterium]
MKIHEYQAKHIFAKFQIPIPQGEVAGSVAEVVSIAKKIGKPVVVKAQVHVGGRGKAGGIKVASDASAAEQVATSILGMKIKGLTVEKVLVEEAIDIVQEYYLGITIDREAQKNIVMVSSAGGIDIEEVAATTPEKIAKVHIDPFIGLRDYQTRQLCNFAQLDKPVIPSVSQFLTKLYTAYISCDASLAEINPLVITKPGAVIAADAKINIDDNALYRHPEFEVYKEESEEDPIEAEAHRRNIQYVRLDGTIGILGNGAGLVMGTLDEVKRAGGTPANFLDIGGGAKAELVKNALEIVLLDKKVKGILFNVFGGITRCDEVAKGIIEATKTMQITVPIVVRLTGTNEKEGLELLKNTNLIPASSMQEAVKIIVEITK